MTAEGLSAIESRSVGINLSWLVPGVVGGSEPAAIRLIEALATAGLRPTLFVSATFLDTYRGWAANLDLPCVQIGVSGAMFGKAGRVLAEQQVFGARDFGSRYNTGEIWHLGGTRPFRSALTNDIVCVHDVQPIDLPRNFARLKAQYTATNLRRAVPKARRIVVPSAFSAGRVQAALGVDPDRVRVIEWGTDHLVGGTPGRPGLAPPSSDQRSRAGVWPALATGETSPTIDALNRLRDERFILYPAIAYPHKNHAVLLEALSAVDGLDLVFTGSNNDLNAMLGRLAARYGVGERFHQLGRVTDQVLGALYERASAVAFPSRYEGFGLPVVEAASAGCRVLVSTHPGLDEAAALVSGAALERIDPDDLAGWTTAFSHVVATDWELADRLAARDALKHRRWADCAMEWLAVL